MLIKACVFPNWRVSASCGDSKAAKRSASERDEVGSSFHTICHKRDNVELMANCQGGKDLRGLR